MNGLHPLGSRRKASIPFRNELYGVVPSCAIAIALIIYTPRAFSVFCGNNATLFAPGFR